MMKRPLLPVVAVLLLVAACAVQPEPAPINPTEVPAVEAVQEQPAKPTGTSESDQIEQEPRQPESTQLVETLEDECPGEATNTIGQGIADIYEFTSYAEVMTWFCNGAEFEDILVALQSEDQSGTPAEEMLTMLSEGLSWEDIWLVVGLMK